MDQRAGGDGQAGTDCASPLCGNCLAPEAGGGARKAPSDQPYINDWACVSGCAYLEPVLQNIFGIQAGLFGKIEARPDFGLFDAKAELRNINYQGKTYTATKRESNGLTSVGYHEDY